MGVGHLVPEGPVTTERWAFEIDVCSECESTFRRPTTEMFESLAVKPELRVVYRVKVGKKILTYFDHMRAVEAYALNRVGARKGRQWRVSVDKYGVAKRLARWLMWHDRETRKRGRSPFAGDAT